MAKLNIDQKKLNLNNPQNKTLMILSIAALTTALGVIGIRYFLDVRAYNGRVIEEREQVRDVAQSSSQALKSLRQSFDTLEAGKYTSREVIDALPSKYDLPALNSSIEQLVRKNDLTMDGLNSSDLSAEAQNSQNNPTPQPIEFSISVKGTYDQIQGLIDDLESSIRPMQVTKFSISGEQGSMSSEIEVVTYYQPSKSLETNDTKEIL